MLIFSQHLFAQQRDIPADTIRSKMDYYSSKKPNSVLFAHFDKTIYNNGETAWFTAYLLNYKKKNNDPSILTALLVNKTDKSVKISLKFAMKNGIAYGNIDIPDSIDAGNYAIVLYTNILINEQPSDVYIQHITIKKIVSYSNSVKLPQPIEKLPPKPFSAKPIIKFYPEGGSLVNATPGFIGMEAKDNLGNALRLKAVLYMDGKAVDTLTTDSYGMGRFKLTPYLRSVYEVKLVGDNNIYWLPKIRSQGPVLHLTNAVVNDMLKIDMWDIHSGRYHIVVHNYHQVFYSYHVMLSASIKSNVLNLNDVPKGLSIITILDSFNHPVAERLFFAHYNRRQEVDIGIDQDTYGQRQMVTLKLKLADYSTDSNAIVSISCVQQSRLQPNNERDIVSYFYLKHEINTLPAQPLFLTQTNADKSLLENILLIKGWRRYNWPEMIKSMSTDKKTLTVMGVKGLIDKTYLDPFSALVNLSGQLDITNYFPVQDKRVHTLLNDVCIKINRQTALVNNQVINNLILNNHQLKFADPVAATPLQISTYKNTVLNTVNIYSTKLFNYIANECGDYVCRFNVLNCTTHKYEKDNTLPKVKNRYTVDDSSTLVNNPRVTVKNIFHDDMGKRIFIVSYNGCANLPSDPDLFNAEGLNDYLEFYSSDYKQIAPTQPDYLSTIYWKYNYLITSKKTTELNFFTSDAFGPFKIIVQGVTDKDVVYAEKGFTVKDR